MRKIIQIVATPETKQEIGALFALCDDGSVWIRVFINQAKWKRIEDIPQDKDES